MAEHILTDFIRALRSADVRVSTGETIDAAKAVSMIGYSDRDRLSNTLRCVLAKSPEEKATHDRLFDLYFARQTPPQIATERAPADDPDTPPPNPNPPAPPHKVHRPPSQAAGTCYASPWGPAAWPRCTGSPTPSRRPTGR